MKEQEQPEQSARPLAPEDVRPDQYVCVMHVVHECIPWWDDNCKKPELLRLMWMAPDPAAPMRVVEVCVPFVLVEQVDGTHRTLDLRRHRLARVTDRFGRRAFKRLRRRGRAGADH